MSCDDAPIYTTSNGASVKQPHASERIGFNGPLLLQDFYMLESLAHFTQERIPERVVHAKGAGAHGYFELTDSLSDITSAEVFQTVDGTQVPLTVRFSTVAPESGSADTVRDIRGFAIKIRTDEGNLDWVFLNTPVFFIRDPAKLPSLAHVTKRNPQTHLHDPDMFWDYMSQNPESMHQIMILFSRRGIPDGYQNMHGFSGNTFKFVTADGGFVYARIHVRADNGFKALDPDTAAELAASNPDYAIQSLFEAIQNQDYPSWTVCLQTMTSDQAEAFKYNIFDLTKTWPFKNYPLRKFGKIVLNKNPENYFAEVEQLAFTPSNLVQGIEPSGDPVLQARLFTYPVALRHRLGVNFQQLPINRPLVPVANFQRDGPAAYENQGSRPNYPSSVCPLKYTGRPYEKKWLEDEQWWGYVNLDLSQITPADFEQPRDLWDRVFDEARKEDFVNRVSEHLGGVKNQDILQRQLQLFANIRQDLANRICKALNRKRVEPLVFPAADPVPFKTVETWPNNS